MKMKKLIAALALLGCLCGLPASVLASGNYTGSLGAANATLQASSSAGAAAVFTVTGTWSATLTPEVTSDGGTTWVATDFYSYTSKTVVHTITANDTVQILWTGGTTNMRIRVSAYTSGTAVVTGFTDETSTNVPVVFTTPASLTAATQLVPVSEKGARWTVVSTPAVSNLATASKSAGAAGVRHVVDCVSFSAGSTTAPVLTQLTVNLRDGASGAGTIIWQATLVIPAATGQNVLPTSICGLGLIGSAATAMTFEYSSLLTNLFENTVLTGYDVQ